MAAVIYQITNIINNEFYIGRTICGLNKRFSQHKWSAKAGCGYHFHRAIRKYGSENFSAKIIEEIDNNVSAEREKHWISLLQPHYNMTIGGEGTPTSRQGGTLSAKHRDNISKALTGIIRSPETRANMSKAQMGNTKALGYIHSAETRAKQAAANVGNKNWLGRRHTPETRQRMREIALIREQTKRVGAQLLNTPA